MWKHGKCDIIAAKVVESDQSILEDIKNQIQIFTLKIATTQTFSS